MSFIAMSSAAQPSRPESNYLYLGPGWTHLPGLTTILYLPTHLFATVKDFWISFQNGDREGKIDNALRISQIPFSVGFTMMQGADYLLRAAKYMHVVANTFLLIPTSLALAYLPLVGSSLCLLEGLLEVMGIYRMIALRLSIQTSDIESLKESVIDLKTEIQNVEAVAELHDSGKSKILNPIAVGQALPARRVDGGLPERVGEEARTQWGSKGRFYASKSFAIGSVIQAMPQGPQREELVKTFVKIQDGLAVSAQEIEHLKAHSEAHADLREATALVQKLQHIADQFFVITPADRKYIEARVKAKKGQLPAEKQAEHIARAEKKLLARKRNQFARRVHENYTHSVEQKLPVLIQALTHANRKTRLAAKKHVYTLLKNIQIQIDKKITLHAIGILAALLTIIGFISVVAGAPISVLLTLAITATSLAVFRYYLHEGWMETEGWRFDIQKCLPAWPASLYHNLFKQKVRPLNPLRTDCRLFHQAFRSYLTLEQRQQALMQRYLQGRLAQHRPNYSLE